eukprot:6485322-Amphidinium_carterae.1
MALDGGHFPLRSVLQASDASTGTLHVSGCSKSLQHNTGAVNAQSGDVANNLWEVATKVAIHRQFALALRHSSIVTKCRRADLIRTCTGACR